MILWEECISESMMMVVYDFHEQTRVWVFLKKEDDVLMGVRKCNTLLPGRREVEGSGQDV